MAKPKKPVLGEMIDRLFSMRNERQERQKELEAEIEVLKQAEKALEDEIINGFTAQDIAAARGKLATAAIKLTRSPSVKDMAALWAWARENDAVDLFYKRVNAAAYSERTEAGEAIPGVEVFVRKDLSLTKAK